MALQDRLLRVQQNLANPYIIEYDNNGKISKITEKTGDALQMAKEIGAFNKAIAGHVSFSPNYDKYNDANIKHEIDIWTECDIYGETWPDACNNYDNNLDIEANMMHDKVVKEMCARISKLKDIKDNGELFREEND